jgi:hypothetical protein
MTPHDQGKAYWEVAALSKAMSSSSGQLSAWGHDTYAINLGGWRTLMSCRTLGGAATVQAGLARAHWALLENNRRLMSQNFLALFGAALARPETALVAAVRPGSA